MTQTLSDPLSVYLAAFNDVRDFIKNPINQIGEEAQMSSLFADIERDCLAGLAFVFVSHKRDGFFILKPLPNNIMQVRVAYSTQPSAIKTYHKTVERLCKEAGVDAIEFETSLASMERFMPRFGWKKAYTVWRKPL